MAPDPRASWQQLQRRRAFDPEPVSVRAVREFAARTLTDWGISDRRDDVQLCVSELATNALLHGGDRSDAFLVVMSIADDVLRVEVRDTSTGAPQLRTPDASSDSGRGLLLVAECADGWGVDESEQSKTVWAEFKALFTWRSGVVSC